MRRPAYHRESQTLGATMTPMIDVIFQLLIFFVCTASFQAAEEVLPTNLSLPGSIDSAVPIDPDLKDLDEIVVKILREEGGVRWEINGRRCTRLAEVRAVLAGVAQVKIDLPVILDVDGGVPLENVIDVYDVCRQLGLERIQFAASLSS
ncbi:MAG: biopolymer transporter ExbD [Rhodopirellula sp.]|nr:biopolymer transporter ExbD [Rhodopirellula sp.]